MPNQIRAAVRVVFDLKIGVLCGFFKSHPSDGLMLWVYWGLLGFIGVYWGLLGFITKDCNEMKTGYQCVLTHNLRYTS